MNAYQAGDKVRLRRAVAIGGRTLPKGHGGAVAKASPATTPTVCVRLVRDPGVAFRILDKSDVEHA